MELLPQDHPRLLSYPNRSLPFCFVARAAEGLPIHIQKLLFFFTSVANSMLDLAHFAVPTIATDVLVTAIFKTPVPLHSDDFLDSTTRLSTRLSEAW